MNASPTPKISVVMPLYNAAAHLRPALDSVFSQTFTDFECILVDDCSTDDTPAILDSYTDPRIVRIRNAQNMGIVGALNRGLDAARGEYIARMDGDDIALPERFARQAARLDARPNVALLGTFFYLMRDDAPLVKIWETLPGVAYSAAFTRWSLLWRTTVQHPTAMIRRSVLEAHRLRYDKSYETAEDFDLWARIARVADAEVLEEPLLKYRINPESISSTRTQYQLGVHFTLIQREVGLLMGAPVPEDLLRFLFKMVIYQPMDDMAGAVRGVDIAAAIDLYLAIQRRFGERYTLTAQDRRSIAIETDWVLRRCVKYAAHSDVDGMRRAVRSRIFKYAPRTFVGLMTDYAYFRARRLLRRPVTL